MNKKVIFVLSGLSVFAMNSMPHAYAQRITQIKAGNFLKLCKSQTTVKICDAYISGLADSAALSSVYEKNEGDVKTPIGFCIAPSVSGKEMINKVGAWLSNHPDWLSKPLGAAVFTALHEAYPCNPTTGGSK